MKMSVPQRGVLFVCLGNICRSPMAEVVFKDIIKKRGLEHMWFSDSAGTSQYHIGESPDSRSLATCRKMLKTIYEDHKGRQINAADFKKFQFIFVMDDENLKNINRVKPAGSTATIKLLGEYDPKGMRIVADPYYGGPDGFMTNFEQITRACENFLQQNP